MSVLIKGMKMPKSCAECFMSKEEDMNDMGARFYYKINCKHEIDYEGKPCDCPLVEISDDEERRMRNETLL